MNSKRVVIIGGSYYGNRGAALMLKNAIAKIREKVDGEVIFDVWAQHAQKNRDLCDDENVRIVPLDIIKFAALVIPKLYLRRMFKSRKKNYPTGTIMESCVNADLFFDISGISFIDDRSPVYLFYDALVALSGIWLNVPVIKAAQACGPFKNPINKFLAKRVMPRITKIYARGEESYLNLKRLRLQNIALAGDVGFADINMPPREIRATAEDMNKPVIGFSVSSVVYGKCQKLGIDYISIINRLADHIENDLGGTVILIPHAVRASDKIKNNDVPVIRKILDSTRIKNIHYFPEIERPYDIRQLISVCDFLVASRFHAMVSSLAIGVPLMVLGWSHKYQEVLSMFDVSDNFITYNDLNEENLIAMFDQWFERRAQIKTNVLNNIEKVKALAELNFQDVAGLLK